MFKTVSGQLLCKLTCVGLIAFYVVASACADGASVEVALKQEREPWLAAYIDLSRICDSKAPISDRERQIDAMLDRYKASGLRIAMPYANTSNGAVYYPSDVAPHRVTPDWDALGYFMSAARKRGIALWPSVCVMSSGHFEPRGTVADHPEWALRKEDGEPWGFLSPAHPEARAWVVAMLKELVTRYEPDGVLLDYLRYFNRPYQLDPAAAAALDAEIAALPEDDAVRQTARQARYEAHLSSLMEAIALAIREARPETRIGLYTWGPHVTSKHLVAQAWPQWVERGWVDVVNVSGYYYETQHGERTFPLYEERLREAVALAGGATRRAQVTVAVGIETSHGTLTSAAQIEEYLQHAADAGVDGAAMFTWSTLEPFLEELIARGAMVRFDDTASKNSR